MTDPLETALAALAPTPPAVNRDRLMYEAGRAAGTRAARRWRLGAAGGGLLAAGLAFTLIARPTTVVVRTTEKPPMAPETPPAPSPQPESPAAADVARWLTLRNAVLADGLTALPPAPPPGPPAGERWPSPSDLH